MAVIRDGSVEFLYGVKFKKRGGAVKAMFACLRVLRKQVMAIERQSQVKFYVVDVNTDAKSAGVKSYVAGVDTGAKSAEVHSQCFAHDDPDVGVVEVLE